jgi:hypothetical protein
LPTHSCATTSTGRAPRILSLSLKPKVQSLTPKAESLKPGG